MYDDEFLDDQYWNDLGNGFSYRFYSSSSAPHAGIFLRCPHSIIGSVPFRGRGSSRGAEWDVVSEEPLTLNPSILQHGYDDVACHGYIRSGRWEDC